MNKNQHFLIWVLAIALSMCNIVLAGEVARVSIEEMRSAVYDELPEGRFTSLSDSAVIDLYSDIANLVVSEDVRYYRITYTIDESTSSRSSGQVEVIDSYIEEVSYADYLDKVVPESIRGGGSTYNSWILLSCYVTRNSSTAGYGDVAFAWLSHPTFYIENYFVVGLNGATYGNTTSKNWYHVYNGSTFWHTMSTKLTNTFGAVFGNIIPYNLNQYATDCGGKVEFTFTCFSPGQATLGVEVRYVHRHYNYGSLSLSLPGGLSYNFPSTTATVAALSAACSLP